MLGVFKFKVVACLFGLKRGTIFEEGYLDDYLLLIVKLLIVSEIGFIWN
jgi:hypothetical protein